MDPFLIGLTALSTIQGMRAARQEQAMRQQQIKVQQENTKIQGIEQHNSRMRNLDLAISNNSAMQGFLGRDDRSLDAIRKRLESDAGEDAARIADNVAQDISQLAFASSVAAVRGENKRRAILLDAFSSAYTNHMRFKNVREP